jgi:predicted ATPase/DNA-binding SARP family transcriptional activator
VLLVGVLGPLESYSPNGQIVVLKSGRQRRLLAALALHANAPVDAELLTELIWGDDPPVDPAAALHTNVARLRRNLPPGVEIVTAPGSYRLVTDPVAIDAAQFGAHLTAAARATGAVERLGELEAALALWRGRPYVELDHLMVTSEVARLTEMKLSADEALADALLSTGRADEAIAVLEALTTQEPLRERPVALLMRALVSAGRQSDALRAYTELREQLAEQLGIDPSPELRRLEQQVLLQEVADAHPRAPSALASRPTLPVSSFVGRDEDSAQTIRLLGGCRIVTVCGPGGVGKSRLARHVAHTVADHYADGVIWVELGLLRDPADVPGAVAAELRLNVVDGEKLSDRIVQVLRVRRHLIVLDNCEHLADAVAGLVEAIAMAADGVDLLLTSREPLRVDGEHLITLAPLVEDAAVTLLTDRLRAVGSRATSTSNDAALLIEIVRRVDRLPLALELAAARVPGLGLQAVRDALDEPYDVLRQGRRTAATRHRSLLDVVDWSYRLLTESQRQLFVQLAVFVGPVEADAIVTVCGADARANTPVVETLSQLVDRSLVTVAVGHPTTYGMLDTLRAFGRRQLSMAPAKKDLRDRHARWALSLAEDTLRADLTPGQALARRRFDAHLADIRHAHEWLTANERTDELLRLTLVFAHHAYHRLRIDLVRLVDETLVVVGDIAHPMRARLLGLSANFGWQRGDLATAEQCCEQAFALSRALKDPRVGREAHEAMGGMALLRGDLEQARNENRRALELAVDANDTITQMLALCDLGLTATYAGDDETAALYNERLDCLAGAVGSPSFLGWASYLRGERQAERDPAEAVPYLAKAVDWAEQVDDRFLAGAARHTLLTSAARIGDPAASLSSFASLIDHWHSTGAWTQLWLALRALTETLARHGRHRDVAILLGASASSARATPVFGADANRLEAAMSAARNALGDAFDALAAQGRAMSDDSAVNFAKQLTREA